MAEAREIRHRITLKSGREETIVSGRIPSPQDLAVYILRLRTGQHLSIRLEPGATLRAYALLKPPSGDQIGPGAKLNFDVNQSGTFQIRIIALEQTSGTFRLHLRTQ
jgi:hypothetical protein